MRFHFFKSKSALKQERPAIFCYQELILALRALKRKIIEKIKHFDIDYARFLKHSDIVAFGSMILSISLPENVACLFFSVKNDLQ